LSQSEQVDKFSMLHTTQFQSLDVSTC